MKKLFTILLASLIILLGSCNRINCDQLPKNYSSYEDAIKSIKAAHFKIQEKLNTSNSSWVKAAFYFSCDGSTGYFILKTEKQEYIYSGVPVDIWNGFKNAESCGSIIDMVQFYLLNLPINYSVRF